MTSSSTYCASVVSVLAFCPNYPQQQAFGLEVNSGAWDFLILEWGKKNAVEMPEVEGGLLQCVYITCMVFTSDYTHDVP